MTAWETEERKIVFVDVDDKDNKNNNDDDVDNDFVAILKIFTAKKQWWILGLCKQK